MTESTNPSSALKLRDYLLLAMICAVLYGWGAFSGRPLSQHESRLPQLSREMALGQSEWILPQSGGRPWLERPPLPHWFTATSMLVFGQTDWAARLPAALMGIAIVLMAAWIVATLLGREMGLLSGIVMATTYEFYTYATLAEDDIFLAGVAVAAMAMFVKSEKSAVDVATWPKSLISKRSISVLLMFILLGLTNLAKGPLVGAAPVIGAIGVYSLWNFDWTRIRKYFWLWGMLIFIALTIAWPLLAWWRYPDVLDNWKYDYTGRIGDVVDTVYNHPFWYYLSMFPMIFAPWIFATVIGIFVTARRALTVRDSGERLIWCWAWIGLLVVSIPARKHHHYFVPLVAPWAIISAIGLVPVGRFLCSGKGPAWMRSPINGMLAGGIPGVVNLAVFHNKIPGPGAVTVAIGLAWLICVWVFYSGLNRRNPRLVLAAFVFGFIIGTGWVQSIILSRDRRTMADMKFLDEVRLHSAETQPIFINASIRTLEFFRIQFYLPSDARLIHNLTFLRDKNLKDPVVYVVTRAGDIDDLQTLGSVEVVRQSTESYAETSPADRFTFFRLTFSPNLDRYPLPEYVGVLEAMQRKKGPWCPKPF